MLQREMDRPAVHWITARSSIDQRSIETLAPILLSLATVSAMRSDPQSEGLPMLMCFFSAATKGPNGTNRLGASAPGHDA